MMTTIDARDASEEVARSAETIRADAPATIATLSQIGRAHV